ncbi:hypothetical protein HNQ93_001116 [Hymenobacter luteus]|uniref:Uncharacterized protein n=2 Tax=Hymenobacter TaxID=89966 RepID=A0A7W9SYV8_9BACT|nr:MULTISPECIES: hypothetical protein [Hymenobacter]MBB4599405.1 hypothetical protein [Hymenobacter latericoloratus]MBB6058286.1 hypothetical protein [Hymenobacter luteus]
MAIDPNNRPVRVINDDTTDQELAAGHIIPGADPPKNESARGGFGNRDGKEGYGTDSETGLTALSVNEEADKVGRPADNMRSNEEGRQDLPNQDMPDDRDPDLQPRRPVDELDADDDRPGRDEMRNPNSRVGMGQMEQIQPNNEELARQGTNADLTDPNASDAAIVQ